MGFPQGCVLALVVVLWVEPCVGRYQELSWVMDMAHISYHPGFSEDKYQFVYTVQHAGPLGNWPFAAFSTYRTGEHMGTHVDAPYHAYEQGKHIDDVPLEDLIGPLVRIDISQRADLDPDATVTVHDLTQWEDKHGPIPEGAFVLMYSGWDKYYGDQILYVGLNSSDGFLHSPGFGKEAAQWLVDNRHIAGVGVDTVNCDVGNNINFDAHVVLLPAGKLCVENLRNLDKVPASGARFAALPIMLKNGTGTQARAFAEWPFPFITATASRVHWKFSLIVAMFVITCNLCSSLFGSV